MYTRNDVNLIIIQKYCEANGIEVNVDSSLHTMNGNSQHGDTNAQAYWEYFQTHEQEILEWLNSYYQEVEEDHSKNR